MPIKNIFINYIRPNEIQDNAERQTFLFLFILTFVQIVAFQTWQTLFTNYSIEVIGLNSAEVGIVQSIRELPGLLAISLLLFLRYFEETTVALASVFLLGIGVMMTGLMPSFSGMLFSTLCMSIGFHYFESLTNSLTLQAFNTRVAPLVIGRIRSISALGTIMVALFLLYFSTRFSYTQLYLFAGLLAAIIALYTISKKPDLTHLPKQRKGLILKKKYWLFYMLTFLSGGRRQIFTIFSLYLLVDKFNYSVTMVTTLFLINNTVNWLLNPLIGRLINILGERVLLTVQFVSAIFIFLGYAYLETGLIIAILYVIDQFTFSFNIAERTFFQKLGDTEDVAPSMAMALTINHIAAVTVPVIGGFLWLVNYQYPFFLGVILAVISLFFVQFIDKQLAQKELQVNT